MFYRGFIGVLWGFYRFFGGFVGVLWGFYRAYIGVMVATKWRITWKMKWTLGLSRGLMGLGGCKVEGFTVLGL